PSNPEFGAKFVNVGAGITTVNGRALLVPPMVVTVTLRLPSTAQASIVNDVVIVDGLSTPTVPTCTPVPLAFTVAPATNWVPFKITGNVLPTAPLGGNTLVS